MGMLSRILCAAWNRAEGCANRDAEALRAWGRAYWKAVHPFNMAAAYVNFLDAYEADDRVEASYGANYRRLAAIKAKYDPNNLFRRNQNIKPTAI
jgi:FAD/FMN-containing dehydrogenase